MNLTDLETIFSSVIKGSKFILSEDSTTENTEGWDSLNHVLILAAIEKTAGIKFRFSELRGLTCAGDLLRLVNTKLA